VPDYSFDKLTIGATPFLFAARRGEVELMRVLAAGGADPSLGLVDGTPPLVAAALGEAKTEGRPGGNERLALGAVRAAIELGAPPNVTDRDGDTAVHIAADRRYHSVIEYLAGKGAALDLRNNHGETPSAVALRPPEPWKGSGVLPEPKPDGRNTVELLRKLGAKE
jgi:cytohesin